MQQSLSELEGILPLACLRKNVSVSLQIKWDSISQRKTPKFRAGEKAVMGTGQRRCTFLSRDGRFHYFRKTTEQNKYGNGILWQIKVKRRSEIPSQDIFPGSWTLLWGGQQSTADTVLSSCCFRLTLKLKPQFLTVTFLEQQPGKKNSWKQCHRPQGLTCYCKAKVSQRYEKQPRSHTHLIFTQGVRTRLVLGERIQVNMPQ